MKKITLVILFIVSIAFTLRAQSYSLQMINSDLNCYLDFFPNKTYLIKLSYKGASDLMMSQIFSFGDYQIAENGNYKLTDRTHQYTFTLEPVSGNKVFMVKDGFQWMQLNFFVKTSERASSPANITKDFLTNKELVNYRERLKGETGGNMFSFSKGLYRSDFDKSLSVNLRNDSTYSVRYYSLELSSGTWEREGNFIKLKDKNIIPEFYALIDPDNSLKSVLIPGDFSLIKFSATK